MLPHQSQIHKVCTTNLHGSDARAATTKTRHTARQRRSRRYHQNSPYCKAATLAPPPPKLSVCCRSSCLLLVLSEGCAREMGPAASIQGVCKPSPLCSGLGTPRSARTPAPVRHPHSRPLLSRCRQDRSRLPRFSRPARHPHTRWARLPRLSLLTVITSPDSSPTKVPTRAAPEKWARLPRSRGSASRPHTRWPQHASKLSRPGPCSSSPLPSLAGTKIVGVCQVVTMRNTHASRKVKKKKISSRYDGAVTMSPHQSQIYK